MNEMKYIKLEENAITPSYGSLCAAGADLYALPCGDIEIMPHETVLVRTGIALQIPDGYVGMICARSGIALKRGLAPANKIGVIDSDYRGEIMVALHNHSNDLQKISSGERIAQLVIMPYLQMNFVEADSLDETERANGGFGSTGTK